MFYTAEYYDYLEFCSSGSGRGKGGGGHGWRGVEGVEFNARLLLFK